MRHIYVQEKITTRILMMHQSRKEIGHRIPFTYKHMIPILRFLRHLYGDFSLELYIFSQIYIYTNTFSCSPYYKYFHKTKQSIGGRGSKNIKGYCKIHVLCI